MNLDTDYIIILIIVLFLIYMLSDMAKEHFNLLKEKFTLPVSNILDDKKYSKDDREKSLYLLEKDKNPGSTYEGNRLCSTTDLNSGISQYIFNTTHFAR